MSLLQTAKIQFSHIAHKYQHSLDNLLAKGLIEIHA